MEFTIEAAMATICGATSAHQYFNATRSRVAPRGHNVIQQLDGGHWGGCRVHKPNSTSKAISRDEDCPTLKDYFAYISSRYGISTP
jgi:hypothetical protein